MRNMWRFPFGDSFRRVSELFQPYWSECTKLFSLFTSTVASKNHICRTVHDVLPSYLHEDENEWIGHHNMLFLSFNYHHLVISSFGLFLFLHTIVHYVLCSHFQQHVLGLSLHFSAWTFNIHLIRQPVNTALPLASSSSDSCEKSCTQVT